MTEAEVISIYWEAQETYFKAEKALDDICSPIFDSFLEKDDVDGAKEYMSTLPYFVGKAFMADRLREYTKGKS